MSEIQEVTREYRSHVVGSAKEQTAALVAKIISSKNRREIAHKAGVSLSRLDGIASGDVGATVSELALIFAVCGYKFAVIFE